MSSRRPWRFGEGIPELAAAEISGSGTELDGQRALMLMPSAVARLDRRYGSTSSSHAVPKMMLGKSASSYSPGSLGLYPCSQASLLPLVCCQAVGLARPACCGDDRRVRVSGIGRGGGSR
jgi:hypothetical protein